MCTPVIPEDSPTVAGSESKINSSMWTLQVLSSPVSHPFVCVPWFAHETYRFRVHTEMFTEKEGYLSRFIHCLTHILGWMQYHLWDPRSPPHLPTSNCGKTIWVEAAGWKVVSLQSSSIFGWIFLWLFGLLCHFACD
jgi:hypothetical protein